MNDNFNLSNLVITDVISATRATSSPVGIVNKHPNRKHWLIVLKIKGKTVYRTKFGSVFSDSMHPVIIPKTCTYTWQCTEPGECLMIEFESEQTGVHPHSFQIKENHTFIKYFIQMEKCYFYKRVPPIENIKNLYTIFLSIIKQNTKEYSPAQKHKIILPAIEYIMSNYSNSNITNDYLAGLCNMSTTYFRKTFTQLIGFSPISYLHIYRIEKAKELLESDYSSIAQIAESVGYNSIYHFSKMFKTHMGISPSKYLSNK